jgi:predicted ester cyclase
MIVKPGRRRGMSEDANLETVRRYVDEVWNKGNLGYIDAVWCVERATECREAWEANRRGYAESCYTIDELIAQGDRVVARWTFHGTRAGSGGMSRAGRAATVTGISMWRLEAGRLIDGHFESEGPGIYE